MKQSTNLYAFRNAFLAIRPDNFSHEGLEVLFDYLEEYEESAGEEIELDVIAICCDFSELSLDEAREEYGEYYTDVKDAENQEELVEVFGELTNAMPVGEDRLIIQQF